MAKAREADADAVAAGAGAVAGVSAAAGAESVSDAERARRRETERLGSDRIAPLVMRLSLPAMLGLLVAVLYQVVDQIFIGIYVGESGLAAMGSVHPFTTLLFAFTILLGRGSAVVYSLALGRRDYAEARRVFSQAVFLQCAVSLALAAVGLCFLDSILRGFGAPEAALGNARAYMSINLLGLPFAMLRMNNHLIRSEGASTYAMMSEMAGAAANVLLDWLMMSGAIGLRMGVAGASLATVMAQGISTAIVFAFFARRSVARFSPRECLPEWRNAKRVIANGVTPFSTHFVATMTWTVQNHTIKIFAQGSGHTVESALAVFAISMKIHHLMITPILGLAMGMQPLVGYNIGARKYARVRKVFLMSLATAAAAVMIPYAFLEGFARPVVSLFGLEGDSLSLGVYTLRRFLLLMPFGSMCIMFSHYFQGTGQARTALLLSLVRQLALALPFMLIIPRYFGFDGIIFAFPASEVCGTIFAMWIMAREFKRLGARMRADDALAASSHSV